jgi:hypothetical protein
MNQVLQFLVRGSINLVIREGSSIVWKNFGYENNYEEKCPL